MILRPEATFTDPIYSLLRYARAFKRPRGVRVVYVRLADITEAMMSSNFLAVSSRATYIRYAKADKMTIKY